MNDDEVVDVELAAFGRHLTREELDIVADELRRLGYVVTLPDAPRND
jgi:hypothetical protein